jgi:hypothetical protein
VYQDEIGESGTHHIQGYVEFKAPKRFSTLKRSIAFGRAHLERRGGTAQQASDYCKKKETRKPGTEPYEVGEISRQGKRNDLSKVKELLDSGASQQKVADEYFGPWVRYRKSFQAYSNMVAPKIRDIEVIVLFGAPGTGKSHWAWHNYPDLWVKPPGPWFDTYQGQETILIDEMAGDYIDYRTLLRLTDKYPLLVPVKGDFVYMRHTRVIICSNFHPNRWYDMSRYVEAGYDTFEKSPLYRRINCMVELKFVPDEKRYVRRWHIGTPYTFPLSAYKQPGNHGLPPLLDQSNDGVTLQQKSKKIKLWTD